MVENPEVCYGHCYLGVKEGSFRKDQRLETRCANRALYSRKQKAGGDWRKGVCYFKAVMPPLFATSLLHFLQQGKKLRLPEDLSDFHIFGQ